MIFQHTYELVLSGVKTETRRLQHRYGNPENGGYFEIEVLFPLVTPLWWWNDYDSPKTPGVYTIKAAIERYITGDMCPLDYEIRPKYIIGKTYAVQPGRGQRAVGRILLTGIRSERVQDITNEGAIAEGILPVNAEYTHPIHGSLAIARYAELWDIIHTRPGERWSANPAVWVLTFELVEEA